MTQQYQQRNINEFGDAMTFTVTVLEPDITLQPSVQTLVVDETVGDSIVTLPLASDGGPNAQVSVANLTGTFRVTVATQGTDALLEAAGIINPISGVGDTLTYRSNGVDTWVAVGATL